MEVKTQLQAGKIQLNYEEVKTAITERLQEFQGAVFGEESISYAKKINAELRAEQKDLDKKRISLKKEWLAPFEEFEKQAKELISLYNEPINFIDEQVKGYEEKCKAEKKIKIKELYYALASEVMDIMPLDKIYNEKWENKTTTMSSIESDITALVTKVNTDIIAIKTMKSDAEEKAINTYKINFDLGQAMKVIAEYEEQKAEIIKRQQEAEIEKAKKEERERIERERLLEEKVKEEALQEQARKEAELSQALKLDESNIYLDTIKSIFTLKGTVKEFEQVEMYLDSIGVEYERTDL